MLVITVELLHGTIRAGSADDTAITGADDPGEWPPSPARLFSALVAGDGTGDRCRVTDGTELAVLESASPPQVVADSAVDVIRSRVRDRFVVVDARAENSVQNYPARSSTLVRPGTRMSPRVPHVHYVWGDLDPDEEVFDAIARRAARVGYLGCADSPVRVRASRQAPTSSAKPWMPGKSGDVSLPVPFEGLTDLLDRAFHAEGGSGRRSGFRSDRVFYADPARTPASVPGPFAEVFWMHLGTTLPGRHATALTGALKAAVLDLYSRATGDDAPPVLHGHGFTSGEGYRLAYWLALPDVGGRNSNGRIHGAAVALPAGTDPTVIETVREALWQLCRNDLTLLGGRSIAVQMFAGDRRPWAANPHRWEGVSRRWVSAFPVVSERWCKRGPDLAEVSRWCEHAGIARPLAAHVSEVPLIQGGVSMRGHEVYRRDTQRTPFMHLAVEFAEPICGPVVLGRMRQHGLGLMAPVTSGGRR